MIYTLTLNPALDREIVVSQINYNQVLRAEACQDHIGGKGLNVSRMLALLGLESQAIGFSGGLTGKKLQEKLSQASINYEFIWIESETRMNLSVITADHGCKRIKINEQGPSVSKTEYTQLLHKIDSVAVPGDWWILCGSLPSGLPHSTYFDIIKKVQSKGGKAFLDTSGSPLKKGCKATPYLIKPDLHEVHELTGIDIKDDADAVKAARIINSTGIPNVVISMGKDGALFLTKQQIWRLEAPEIKEINPLLGGLIWGLYRRLSPPEALRWGVACGSIAAGFHGTNFATFAEVQDLKNQLEQVRKMQFKINT